MNEKTSIEEKLKNIDKEFMRILKERSREIGLNEQRWRRESIEHMHKTNEHYRAIEKHMQETNRHNRTIRKLVLSQTYILFIMMLLMAFFLELATN